MLDLISSTGDKYNEEEPNAFDLFKEFHYSKKKKLLHHCCMGGYCKISFKLFALCNAYF